MMIKSSKNIHKFLNFFKKKHKRLVEIKGFIYEKTLYRFIPIHMRDIFFPNKEIDDYIIKGNKKFLEKRSIYYINDINLIKKRICIETKNNVFINILGSNIDWDQLSGRKILKNYLNFFESFFVFYRRTIKLKGKTFFYLPKNPQKNNYWHCLIDNISQLLFVLRFEKIDSVVCYENCSKVHKNYLIFLSSLYSFEIIFLNRNSTRFSGVGVFTESSLKFFHIFNKEIAQQKFQKANEEIAQMGPKHYDKRFKSGEFVYPYKINNSKSKDANVNYLKDYSMPVSTPILKSSLDSFNDLSAKIKGKNIKRIFSERNDQITKTKLDVKTRNISNKTEVYARLKSLDFSFIKFDDYSFKEQISFCKNLDILIGVHGTNLVNLVFMKKNSLVINLIPRNYSIPKTDEVRYLCEIKSIRYREVICEDLIRDNNLENYGSFEVNMISLNYNLKKIDK